MPGRTNPPADLESPRVPLLTMGPIRGARGSAGCGVVSGWGSPAVCVGPSPHEWFSRFGRRKTSSPLTS